MKTYSFLIVVFLAMVSVNARRFLHTKEHVKRFFRPEHRQYLSDTTMLQLQDEDEMEVKRIQQVQEDDSTKCLPVCEPQCDKVDVPDYLLENSSFHKFEDTPIKCVLASTVVFEKSPEYKCKWLGLYLFDCCRACNAEHAKCLKKLKDVSGGPEYCYREDNYKCMCKCLAYHQPLENHFLPPTTGPTPIV